METGLAKRTRKISTRVASLTDDRWTESESRDKAIRARTPLVYVLHAYNPTFRFRDKFDKSSVRSRSPSLQTHSIIVHKVPDIQRLVRSVLQKRRLRNQSLKIVHKSLLALTYDLH